MPLFLVTYTHPDESGWNRHLQAHVRWVTMGVERGIIRAGGPLPDQRPREAMMLLDLPSLHAAREFLETDPFQEAEVVTGMTLRRWDPMFGLFNAESSRPGPHPLAD